MRGLIYAVYDPRPTTFSILEIVRLHWLDTSTFEKPHAKQKIK